MQNVLDIRTDKVTNQNSCVVSKIGILPVILYCMNLVVHNVRVLHAGVQARVLSLKQNMLIFAIFFRLELKTIARNMPSNVCKGIRYL